MLKIDWYLDQPIDFEYKNYILLDYIQSLDKSYQLHQLSPYLLWTERMVIELREFNQRKKDFFNFFERKKLIVDNGKLSLKTVGLSETEEIKTIIELIDYSTPLLESKVKLGYKLLSKYPQILF